MTAASAQQLHDYLAAPGKITFVGESFGEVCAGFQAVQGQEYPGFVPNDLGWFIEDAHIRDDLSLGLKASGTTESCRYKEVVDP